MPVRGIGRHGPTHEAGGNDEINVEGLSGQLAGPQKPDPIELQNLTTAEIQQLENIGTTTISAAQWGYLGSLSGAPLENIVEDTTPQLGGDLEANNHAIIDILKIDTKAANRMRNFQFINGSPSPEGSLYVGSTGWRMALDDIKQIGSKEGMYFCWLDGYIHETFVIVGFAGTALTLYASGSKVSSTKDTAGKLNFYCEQIGVWTLMVQNKYKDNRYLKVFGFAHASI